MRASSQCTATLPMSIERPSEMLMRIRDGPTAVSQRSTRSRRGSGGAAAARDGTAKSDRKTTSGTKRRRAKGSTRDALCPVGMLEAEADAELHRARLTVAAAKRGEDEEVRQPLIGAERHLTGVAEIRRVEDVEQLEVRVDRLLLQRTEAIGEPQIGLAVRRTARAIAAAVEVGADGIQSDAAIVARGQQIEQPAVAIGVDARVIEAHRRSAEIPEHAAGRQAVRPGNLDASADREVLPAVGVERAEIAIQLRVAEHLVVVVRRLVC